MKAACVRADDRAGKSAQRGTTLLVGLVMLSLMTLLAISAFNATSINVRVVGNAQSVQQAQEAAVAAINRQLSSSAFAEDAKGTTYSVPADINQDRVVDFNVAVAPTCYQHAPIRNVDLTTSVEDFKCYTDSVYSLCGATNWDFQADVVDPVTGASVTVHQGVGMRATTDAVPPACQ